MVHLTKFIEKHSSKEEDYENNLTVAEIPVPKPKSGEVLVLIKCSAINPSDLSHLTGTYNRSLSNIQIYHLISKFSLIFSKNSAQREKLPCQVGFEASGLVIQSGGGLLANSLVGKRVGVCSTSFFF